VNRPEGEATHITNTQVGYVLLLDSESRIRWMATGMPWPGELEALVKGVRRIVRQESVLQMTETNGTEENEQASRETNYAA
jgi:ATP10 protein